MTGQVGWDVGSGPGVTALGLAAARSVETSRDDRLVADPYARSLFEAASSELPMLVTWPAPGTPVSEAQALHLHGSRYIGLRTRVYDDLLVAAAAEGVRQAVLLGAGLDTRAFRLDLPPDLRLFEVDQGGVLAYKERVLSELGATPRCPRATARADLRGDWTGELRGLGFDARRPTAWIAEGLLAYLPADAQSRLLAQVGEESAAGSRLALDRIVGDLATAGRLEALSRRSGIAMDRLLAPGEPGDPRTLLQAAGWAVREETAEALATRYGRDLRSPFPASASASEPPWLDTCFVTARR